MVLLIDQGKIEEQLANTPRQYVVTTCNIETEPIRYEIPAAHVSGTVIGMPPDLERARERMLSLRQRIIDRGTQPVSRDGLERLIDETRGRS